MTRTRSDLDSERKLNQRMAPRSRFDQFGNERRSPGAYFHDYGDERTPEELEARKAQAERVAGALVEMDQYFNGGWR